MVPVIEGKIKLSEGKKTNSSWREVRVIEEKNYSKCTTEIQGKSILVRFSPRFELISEGLSYRDSTVLTSDTATPPPVAKLSPSKMYSLGTNRPKRPLLLTRFPFIITFPLFVLISSSKTWLSK